MKTQRIDKINSLIQTTISHILITKIDREHFKLLTVTRVITSKDMSLAKVYVSLPQGTFASFVQWSKKHMYHIQGELNNRLSLYKAPRIVFVEDTTSQYVDRIEELLRKVKSKSD